VLLVGPQADKWCVAAREAAQQFVPFDLVCRRLGRDLNDADGRCLEAYGLTTTGATLVRPDGFVCWRATTIAEDPIGALAQAFAAVKLAPSCAAVAASHVP
jgi:putative polyketide hydroxylase